MAITERHKDFEKFSQKLLGHTIVKVEYAESDFDDPIPYYPTKFKNLDSISFSIFLHTDKNETIEIYWDDEFFQFGIGIKLNEKSDFSNFKIWDVTNNDLWQKFIGTKIIEVKLNWEEVTYSNQTTYYPQDIKMEFSNSFCVFISASRFFNYDDDEVSGMSDNLIVT